MFDFNDEDEERKRTEWYSPLGEFMLLFSNLEFTCNEWVDMLCDSNVMAIHIKSIWSFKKRVDLIIKLIDEYQIDEPQKALWKSLWQTVISKIGFRNTIAHNPPFDNFGLEFDSNYVAKSITRHVEIHKLSKPIGEPGSGITLDKLLECNLELRKTLIQLDNESNSEAAKWQ